MDRHIGRLNFSDLLSSLAYLNEPYENAGLNAKVNYLMLCMSSIKYKLLSDVFVIEGTKSFTD